MATVIQSANELPLVIWHVPEDARGEVLATLDEHFPEGYRESEEAVGESLKGVSVITV